MPGISLSAGILILVMGRKGADLAAMSAISLPQMLV